MEKYTEKELLEILPIGIKETKELTTKQKTVLGQLVMLNGLDKVKNEGYFFRSNQDLSKDCNIQEKTLIVAIRKLEMLGFLERKKGNRKDGASEYRLNMDVINNYCKTEIDNDSDNDSNKNYSKIITSMHVRITELELTVKRLENRITVIEGKNYSTDTESDIDKEKEKDKVIYNNNIIKKQNFEKIENKEKTEEVEVKEVEIEEEIEKENLNESQLPYEVLVNTDELDNINDNNTNNEESYVPTEEEKKILKDGLKVVDNYLIKMQSVNSEMIIYSIKDDMVKDAQKFIDSSEGITAWVIEQLEDKMNIYFNIKRKELVERQREKIKRQLQQQSLYASFY